VAEPEIDTGLIDEAVLALMYLALHSDGRAWKGFDWGVMGRLHDKDLIFNPVGKAKSVALTDEGLRRCEEAFVRLFSKRKQAL
jgi:hypothetical protein